ncbi:WD40 repeat-like protein [Desmophyllum pertusum]|uniref:WD40 repeat-like protein n=1 Tax=Desmophyllum pertusum TaxID=174260 RepID=A0A9W9YPU1_9CNID|nr:WD40 repeat-like protein [Desmophyllum pertusum]
MPTTNKEGENTSEVLSQRFSRSVGLSSHGNQDEELSAIRGAEMATNTITVLSKYGDGKHIACALANKSAHMLRPPPSSKETVFTGHDGSVTSVNFSHDSRLLLTSSCDRTARLWSPAHSDPLMTFSSVNHNFASELDSSAKVKENPPFTKEIIQARFYYVDKFVLLACGNGLHMYKYHIDVGHKDDVKRSGQLSSEFCTCVKRYRKNG